MSRGNDSSRSLSLLVQRKSRPHHHHHLNSSEDDVSQLLMSTDMPVADLPRVSVVHHAADDPLSTVTTARATIVIYPTSETF